MSPCQQKTLDTLHIHAYAQNKQAPPHSAFKPPAMGKHAGPPALRRKRGKLHPRYEHTSRSSSQTAAFAPKNRQRAAPKRI